MKQDTLSALRKQFYTLRLLYLLCLVLAVAALAVYFVDRRATLAVLGVNLLFYLLAARPRAKAYQRTCIESSVLLTLSRYLEQAGYASPALDPAQVCDVRLVPEDRPVVQKEGGRGLWRGSAVIVSEVVLGNSYYLDAQRKASEYLTGIWVRVELGRDTGLDCRLIGKDLIDPRSRAAYFVRHPDLHDPGQERPQWLAEGWEVLAGRSDELPRGQVLNELKKLAEYTPTPMAMAVTGDVLSVFLSRRLLWRKVSVRQAPSEAWLNFDLLPELGYILELANRLIRE